MHFLFLDSVVALLAVWFVAGLLTGRLLATWIERMTPPLHDANDCSNQRRSSVWIATIATGVLFALFVFAMERGNCQRTPMVTPGETALALRTLYHLVLISLLIAATGTDLREYVIPDEVTLPGTIFAIVCAFAAGDLQMMHLWIDWNEEVPGVVPAFVPAWIDEYRRLHGLAVSATGAAVGAGVTWLVRATSGLFFGREALGFGDVTLMGMIGAFTGWQPLVFVFLLAPLCGLVVGLGVRLATGQTFIPYGPYLSLATLVVLFTWRRLWLFEWDFGAGNVFSVRRLLGDGPSLAILGGASLGGFVVLLGLLRVYRAIPVTRHRRGGSDGVME